MFELDEGATVAETISIPRSSLAKEYDCFSVDETFSIEILLLCVLDGEGAFCVLRGTCASGSTILLASIWFELKPGSGVKRGDAVKLPRELLVR